MWRSNVLRLRKHSSSVIFRHGVIGRWYSSQQSLPVTEKEFEDALKSVSPWASVSLSNGRLGFAISGGVDSMALAALYSRAQLDSLPKAHAFIVDHKVRNESTEEAAWVREVLRSKLHMDATVITLDWPQNPNSLDMKRFETEARTLRYQALGRACRDMNINAMMVAHHGDDQAETVMMRLARNRLRSGLRGMQNVDWIPECEGIHGVHHSGAKLDCTSAKTPFPVEGGGIRVLRPLLGFPKARLIASCEKMGVKWAEDKSNQVQTLTSRNAIRHIYRTHQLPQALTIQSLVNLSQSIAQRMEQHNSFAERLFNDLPVKLDIQTGSLLIHFPPFEDLLQRPITSQTDKNEAWNTAFYLLKRVAGLITPDLRPGEAGALAGCIENIFPEFQYGSNAATSKKEGESATKSFTVHHIWWRQWPGKRSFFDRNKARKITSSVASRYSQPWLLTRQALMDEEARDQAKQILVPPQQLDSASAESMEYQLFDGRWWIRIRNLANDKLILRIFQEQDMHHILDESTMKQDLWGMDVPRNPTHLVRHALNLLKPNDIRFTIPALFSIDPTTGQESLIGFPTLNVHTSGFGHPSGICEWDVRYKKVEFGTREPQDVIIPGVTVKDIQIDQKRFHKNVEAAFRKADGKMSGVPSEERTDVVGELGGKKTKGRQTTGSQTTGEAKAIRGTREGRLRECGSDVEVDDGNWVHGDEEMDMREDEAAAKFRDLRSRL